MKFLAALLLLLMVLFAFVQWNDPDGVFWAAVYALPAGLMGLILWRRHCLASTPGRVLVIGVLVTLGLGTVLFWPEQAAFWTQAVWWEEETAREGLGMMIALLVSAVALPAAWRGAAASRSQS